MGLVFICVVLFTTYPAYSKAKCITDYEVRAKAIKSGFLPMYAMRDSDSGSIIRIYFSVVQPVGIIVFIGRDGCVSDARKFDNFTKVKTRGA